MMDPKDEQIRLLEAKVASLELQVASQQKELTSLKEAGNTSSSNPNQVDLTTVWPSAKVRETFLNYFIQKRNHTFWKSSSVVPHDDPTLLFANAGMNQYKSIFLGTVDPKLELSNLKRAVNSQKCIRAGGKHNDLDDVGKDTYHHTFFEMLGNWSFGDYFKEEAIEWAFDCLVNVFGLDPSRMYATYFEGDPKQGLAADLECKRIWEKYLPVDRIIPGNAKDNFWEMGEVGPCGPCTEVHYDRLPGLFRPELVNMDDPNLIEIWNNVFIQFNREVGGILKELPSKHVDTGMGFERLTSILQDKPSNYDTDVFLPIFAKIQEKTGFPRPYTGKLGEDDLSQGNCDTAYRVVADHIRTLTFAITDGAIPSNDGRGYVLRRVLRRGVRYGQQILGAQPGFFHQLVETVVENFSNAFPELQEKKEFVKKIILEEEMSFNVTLEKGLIHFNKVAEQEDVKKTKIFPAKESHFLYATLGFPIDLTKLMAEEVNIIVDEEGFQEYMDKEKQLSKVAQAAKKSGGKGKDLTLEAEQTSYLRDNGIDPTESGSKYIWHHEPSGSILSIFLGRNVDNSNAKFGFVTTATPEDGTIGILLDRTAFYAEQGGQIYDTGVLTNGNDTFRVDNVQLFGGYVLHMGCVESGRFQVEDTVTMMVNYDRRSNIAPNHTMTHVLNFALRKVLLENEPTQNAGNLCDQKGSSVDDSRLRFDFSWNGPIPIQKLALIEEEVNRQISDGRPVFASARPLEAATKINSLRQVFNEQYPDPVRVLSVGVNVEELIQDPTNEKWMDYSIEFCGGTHLNNTSEAVAFKIVEESGIAKGIRRITAVTKNVALEARDLAIQIEEKINETSKLPDAELESQIKIINAELSEASISCVDKEKLKGIIEALIQRVLKFKKEDLKRKQSELLQTVTEMVNNPSRETPHIIVHCDFGSDSKIAKKVIQDTQKANPDISLLIISGDASTNNIYLFSGLSKTAIDAGLDGIQWLTKAAEAGGGGRVNGKKNNASSTLVGKYPNLENVLNAAKEYINAN